MGEVGGSRERGAGRRRRGRLGILLGLWLAHGIVGCSGDPGSGPAEVRWDRYPCERCRMVLSDRHHAAQVRWYTVNGPSRVAFFDDIGCALIWLEDKPFRETPGTEIWVTDWRTGDWIDARSAVYVRGQVTPMEYGLGAQTEPVSEGLDFQGARDHILEVERRFNVHGAHLEHQGAERSRP